ncbi:unnamed protein product [Mytilus coruscus]|uniref:Uncharacterized protein n=1 Tax=Mytilus coruscus TaxID=42192 RepID=A0A6J8BRS8_MYTCO|nr:unnamed protein product [Mytilus coruscus]
MNRNIIFSNFNMIWKRLILDYIQALLIGNGADQQQGDLYALLKGSIAGSHTDTADDYKTDQYQGDSHAPQMILKQINGRRKTCENFSFFTLDDAEFRKATRANSILHFQVNLLQTNQNQILKEKVKLESVVDLIKHQMKENRKSLRKEIEDLKQENKTLKTKLQKTVSDNKDSQEEVDFLHNENNVLSVIVRDLKNQIADLEGKEFLNKTSIGGLAARCLKLETENNALR